MRQECLDAAYSLLKTPYKHQGRSKAGLDCVGFLYLVSQKLGMEIDYPKNYNPTPNFQSIPEMVETYYTARANIDDRLPGDIVTFFFANRVHHVAIVVDDQRIIHSINRKGSVKGEVVIDNINEKRVWSRTMHNVYDLESYTSRSV